MRVIFSTVTLFILYGVLAGAEIPALNAAVTDRANILSVDRQLENALQDYHAKTGVQIAVLTVNDLGEESIEDYSMRVVEAWGLGSAEKDNGALLLIAANAHRVRIEVGYGLEEKLTDLMAGRIIRERITPHFRNGDYDRGVIDGVKAMVSVISAESNQSRAEQRAEEAGDAIGPIIMIIFIILFLRLFRRDPMAALVLGSMLSRGSRGGFGGGGFRGGGSGFGGFSGGGGGFGGGGASGSW